MTVKKIFQLLRGSEEDRSIALEFLKINPTLRYRVLTVYAITGIVRFSEEKEFKKITGSGLQDWWDPLEYVLEQNQEWGLETIKQILEEDEKENQRN